MDFNQIMILLFTLLGGHFFLDYAGQGQFLSEAKNPTKALPGVPWTLSMFSHSMTHGAFVAYITQIWWLGLIELVSHFIIDTAKCTTKYISFTLDQMTHVAFKIAYLLFIIA